MGINADVPTMPEFNTTSFTVSENMQGISSTINPIYDLEIANRRVSNTLIPSMVYVGVLMFVGTVGNTLVFYVFGFRLKRNAQNFFIILLAVFDFLSCTIAFPTEIVDMALHFKFNSAALCKIMRLVTAFTAMSSICTLIVIAVDRYRRVRKPLKAQITSHHARLSLIPITIISLIFSAPALYVYGLRTVDTGIAGVKGLDCTISDEAKQTIVPLVYNGVLFICFIILAISLIVMYALILRSLKEHARCLRKASIGTMSTGNESLTEPVSVNDESPSTSHAADDSENKTKENQLSNSISNSMKDNLADANEQGKANDCMNILPSIREGKICTPSEEQKALQNKVLSGVDLSIPQHSSLPRQDVDERGNAWRLLAVLKEEDVVCVDEAVLGTFDNEADKKISSNNVPDLDDQLVPNVQSNTGFIVTDNTIEIECNCNSVNNDILKEYKKNVNATYGSDRSYNAEFNEALENTTQELEFKVDKGANIKDSREKCEADTNGKKNKKSNCYAAVNGGHCIHHVSFDVNCTSDSHDNTDTAAHVSNTDVSDWKRRTSKTPFLNQLDDQPQGFITTLCKCHSNTDQKPGNPKPKKLGSQKQKRDMETPRKRNITRKTTIIAFVVTLVFIISFVPHLCLQVAHLIRKGFDEKLEGASLALYNTFLRSYFINSVANPIIYGVMNENFRNEVKLLLIRLRCWKR